MNVTETFEVPDYIKDVCALWHDGQTSLMYSVASTGKIQYQYIYALLQDMPHANDDPDATATERTQIRNSRQWLNGFIDDEYFETLERSMLEDEETYSIS